MRPETRPRYDLVTLKLQRTPLQLLNPKSLAHPPSTPQSFYLSRNHAQEHAATHKGTLSIAGFHLSPFGSLDQFLSSHRLRYVIFFFGYFSFSLICLLSSVQVPRMGSVFPCWVSQSSGSVSLFLFHCFSLICFLSSVQVATIKYGRFSLLERSSIISFISIDSKLQVEISFSHSVKLHQMSSFSQVEIFRYKLASSHP